MEQIDLPQLQVILTGAGIAVADPSYRIGRQLTFSELPLRTVVVHFGQSDSKDYISKVVEIVLQTEAEWVLTTRYGTASDLGIIEGSNTFAAILFKTSERGKLVDYLTSRPMNIGRVSSDLYVLSKSGDVLVTWDHHTSSEGLQIELCKVGRRLSYWLA